MPLRGCPFIIIPEVKIFAYVKEIKYKCSMKR